MLFCFLAFTQTISAQNDSISGVKLIDFYLLKKQTHKADSTLKSQIQYYQKKNQFDSLHNYPYYIGKVALLKYNAKQATQNVEAFLELLKNKTKNKKTLYKALLNQADFYDEIGENSKSLETTKLALDAVLKAKEVNLEEIGKVYYNIGVTQISLGKINEAKTYFQNALARYESYSKTAKQQLSDGYNAMGATMWLSTKLDSAKYYYDKAEKTITHAKGDSILNLYLGTVIKSNVSLLEYTQGNLADAVVIQNNVISNYEKVILNYHEENIVSKAKRFQGRAISNLAIFYNEQGNLKKANEVLNYSYKKLKESLEPNDINLISSLIQIGQSQVSLTDFDKAIITLEKGIKQLDTYKIENPYWKAAGFHALAEAYSGINNTEKALHFYQESERLFKQSLNKNYDKEFLNFLKNKAIFLSKNGNPKHALTTAKDAYNYVVNNTDENSFSSFIHILNIGEVYNNTKDYKTALIWIEKANQNLEKRLKNSKTKADSIQISFYQPKLILLKSKAKFGLNKNPEDAFIKQQIHQLDKALKILERRKTTLYKREDISVLLTDYKSVTDYSKQLSFLLYKKNNDYKYLNKTLELHESTIYNSIRSRLNLKNKINFSNIPILIVNREKELKRKVTSTLNEDNSKISSFFEAETTWQTFLDSLKQDYPKYYKMRYANIETNLENLQKNIPVNTTVVRYLFIEEDLYAFVADKIQKDIYKLDSKNIKEFINVLAENQSEVSIVSPKLHKLYEQLWQPFEKEVKTENVIIIPDGELFNLSFETLTPTKINSFKELATNSLLTKHNISYNYSLLLLDKNRKTIDYSNDFIAFAPEFNDKMKNDYRIAITDSIEMDKTYLKLLPQPFSVDLAKEFSRLFKGESFLNEKASKTVFINEANEHKIIHIGTHAESNNISPELSRLIFAKNAEDEDNSLYTYEIYNQNLNSNLAILTACETGKPTYQSGEGMISLAHAFNYAGSESILTSLWKIDEQSSTQIIKYFYNYLAKGLTKDKALQQAKLDYLANAEGRTIAPQYWAGLVLIGDASPINISTSSNNLFFWIFGVLAIILIAGFFRKRKNIIVF
jgi:CHAT domain-containing protein/tetratricopeptide (TPR) repeat protein